METRTLITVAAVLVAVGAVAMGGASASNQSRRGSSLSFAPGSLWPSSRDPDDWSWWTDRGAQREGARRDRESRSAAFWSRWDTDPGDGYGKYSFGGGRR